MLLHTIFKSNHAIGRLSALRWLPIAVAIGVLSTFLFLGLNWLSLGRGGSDRIRDAFASHALIGDYLAGDTNRGKHQFNDCLILGMALDQRAPVWELTVSPTIPFPSAPDVCKALQLNRTEKLYFYHNYVHGQTTLVRYLLPLLQVEEIRRFFRTIITALLLIGIGISMLRIASGKAIRDQSVFLVVLLSFSRFFGLEMFGQSLGHGPADAVLIGYIVFLAFNAGKLSAKSMAVAAAVFGSLTMIFELLTGGLPLGLAAVLGLSWFALKAPERSLSFIGLGGAIYLAAASAAAATKLLAVAVVFGPQTLLTIGRAAQQRVNGVLDPVFGEPTLLKSVLGNMDALAPGLGPLTTAILLIALASSGWAVWRHHRRPEVLLLAASNVPILLWPMVFQQHMMIHAWFMDRIFVWTIASGFALFLLTTLYQREGEPSDDALA